MSFLLLEMNKSHISEIFLQEVMEEAQSYLCLSLYLYIFFFHTVFILLFEALRI